MSPSSFSKTPTVTVLDSRGLIVRDIAYCRHPAALDKTDERVTRHQYDVRGFLMQSADPRLQAAGRANFTWLTDLTGVALRTRSADAGTTVALRDVAGRPFRVMMDISTGEDGKDDLSQAVTQVFTYEGANLPGRPVSVTEQVTGEAARITERFVYADNTDAQKALNLAGQCVSHYDTAGLIKTDSIAVTGVPLSVTRLLLKDAEKPDVVADWQGDDASAWNDLLDGEAYGTLTTADATGAALTTTDAKGNVQRVAYDVAGLLSGSWLTLKGGEKKVIVASLTYSPAGQKLREEHGNGVVTTYEYEPETQRLTGIKTERPAGHASGAKVLQNLRYEYDPVGNVLKITNDAEETRFWRNQKVVPENTYTYDSLYQLVSATGREMANAGQQGCNLPSAAVPLHADSSAYTCYTRTYFYDNAGNLTQVRHSPAAGRGYTTRITVSDRSNRGVLSTLTENAADVDALFAAGGQQKQLQPGQALRWTPRNELLKVTPVVREGAADDYESYRYDSGSQRALKVSVQKTGGTTQTQRVLYLPRLEQRTTTAGDKVTEALQVITVGEAGRAQVRVLHWEGDPPTDISNDLVRWIYDNLTGSSSLELDADSNIISMEEYYPYGGTAVWSAQSAVEAKYKTVRYSGKERDATGLYYYGYRYYQPWVGRWLSSDPAGTVDGLNLFRMVRNNPVSLYDTDGRSPESEQIAQLSKDIQIYAQRVDVSASIIDKIYAVVDANTNSDHRRGTELLVREGAGLTAKYLGGVGGGAAGGAVGGALFGSAILPGVGTVTGAGIGMMIGAIGGKTVVGKIADKLGLKSARLQTSDMNSRLDRIKDREITEAVKDFRGQYAGKDSRVTYGSLAVKKVINEATGVSLPVSGLYKMGRMIQEMGQEFTPEKIGKIDALLDRVDEILSDENYIDITMKFDRISKLSGKTDKAHKVSKRGIVNTISLGTADKIALSNKRTGANKRLGDIRRMLN